MKFSYAGFDRSGKPAGGTVDGSGAAEAREELRRRGLFVTELREAAAGDAGGHHPVGRPRRLGAGQRLKKLAMFSRQLHVLVGSGTPIVQALGAIERQCEGVWREVIAELRQRVEEGEPLSEAMRRQPQYFDAVCRSLVAAGESCGNLPQMLDRQAGLARKQLHLRNSVLGAMIYPCVLIGLGAAVLAVMLLFVLPRFSGLFATLDSPLPPTTLALLWLSGVLRAYWWGAVLVLGAAGAGLRVWLESERGRRTVHTMALNLPKVGKLARSVMTARLARMLGVLLESRVALLDALELTRPSLANLHYVELVARAEDAVARGEPVSAVLGSSDLISACVQEAVRNGELTGQLGTPLLQMADFLDEENDVVVKSLTSIIEPLILIGLGLLVGAIALSMFLPLFDLVSAAHG